MADETPENETTPDEAAPEAAPTVDEAAPKTAPAAPAAGGTRRERLEAKRAARRPAPRGAVSIEQREAERLERRAHTAKQRRVYRARQKEKRAALRTERPVAEPVQATEHGPGRAKVRQGVVVSSKGDKTITVAINVVQRHRRYRKILRSTIKLHAHDEANTANEGDTVRVVECRPMSRSKRWRLADVVERAR